MASKRKGLQSLLHCDNSIVNEFMKGQNIMNIVSRTLLSAGALGFALAPIAAQAGTRAGDSGVIYSAPVSAPGTGKAAKGENAASGGVLLLAVAAVGLIVAGIVVASSSDNDQSPGT